MANIIVVACILILVALAIFILWKNKKKGVKCAGCPYAGTCNTQNCRDKK